MDLNTKILWFFIVLCYCLTAPSCRMLKRSMEKERERVQILNEKITSGSFTRLDTSSRDFTEWITFDFKFRDIGFPDMVNRNLRSDENIDSDIPVPVNLSEFESLLDRVTDLKVEIKRVEKENKSSKIDSGFVNQESNSETRDSKSKKSDKESDSTWSANIPWYAWVIGAVLIFGIVAYSWKQIRP